MSRFKHREKYFLISGIIVFLLSWRFFTIIVDAAQAVGDATLDISPLFSGFKMAIILIFVYALVYYGVAFVIAEFRKNNK